MSTALDLTTFLELARDLPVVDVRSPAEFAQGHLPGAVNLPLFSNAERAEIGTTYVQQGRQPAVLLGLARVGARLADLGASLVQLGTATQGRLLVHCWRGGMRSASMAWLAEQVGLQAATLAGGYKTFRRWALESPGAGRAIRVVAGLTGSGKTDVLQALTALGEPVLDLERLAHHKGSAFGAIGELPQPTQEQFENDLALAWHRLPPGKPVWVEDENRSIGRVHLPEPFWRAKQAGRYHVLTLPENVRLQYLVNVYGAYPPELLEAGIKGIEKRLGGLRTRQAIDALRAGEPAEVCRVALTYYDPSYQKALEQVPAERRRIFAFDRLDSAAIAAVLAASPPPSP